MWCNMCFPLPDGTAAPCIGLLVLFSRLQVVVSDSFAPMSLPCMLLGAGGRFPVLELSLLFVVGVVLESACPFSKNRGCFLVF